MLEYAKIILPKVSFSEDLFRKELGKCINWVEPEQLPDLFDWSYANFKTVYPEILADCFANVAA